MILSFSQVAMAIEKALRFNPFGEIKEFCGDYYSPYYMFMMLVFSQMREYDKLAVELGCDQGRGLLSLSLAGGLVVGVDHTRKSGIDTVMKEHGDNIVFLEQSSLPIPEWFDNGKRISLLHIDTEHSYAQAREEFNHYRSLLTDPAIVIFDDLHAKENEVLKFFMSLPYPKIQDDRLHPECGWGVVYYTEEK